MALRDTPLGALGWQVLLHQAPDPLLLAVGDHRAHLLELAEAEEAVLTLEHGLVARVGDDLRPAVQREDGDVALVEAGVAELLADHVGAGVHDDLGDAVAGRDGQPLAYVDVGEGDLVGHVVDDRAGHVELGRALDALEAGRGVDLHHLRAATALQHVDTGDAQAHDLRGPDGHPLELLVELDRLDAAAAVHVRAELVALRDPPHRRDHAVPDDEGADVAALALLHEALDQDVLP